jgi:hypothetical protein
MAVQADRIKPTLKAPGTKRLKLPHDEPLSSFAFEFNLRRFNLVERLKSMMKETVRVQHEVSTVGPADITSHHITSHHITPYHITSHHITSHHITSPPTARLHHLPVHRRGPTRYCSPRHRTPFDSKNDCSKCAG